MDQAARKIEDLPHQPAIQVASAVPEKGPWLLGKTLDILMVGGASILLFVASWFFIDPTSSTVQISWTAFYLAIVVNNPHFMASYLLLYHDRRDQIFKNIRYFWAAIGAPLLVAGYMGTAVALSSSKLLGYAVNAMYFLVGWHYVKQIYGTLVVSSARQKYYFTPRESLILKLTLFPIWFLSYFNGNQGIRDLLHYGVGYQTLSFPPWVDQLNKGLLVVGIGTIAYIFFTKWARNGRWPSVTGLVSLAAIFIWYLPEVYHPHFWYMIPFFHSLQYMLFVLTLKNNQFWSQAQESVSSNSARLVSPAEQIQAIRSSYGTKMIYYLGSIILLGALFFKYIPEALDQRVVYDQTVFGKELFVFLFITFINIHHYFIDNVIWRRDNPMVKKYL